MATILDKDKPDTEKKALVAIRKLRREIEQLKYRQNEPIAIVGLSGRFPQAPDLVATPLVRLGDRCALPAVVPDAALELADASPQLEQRLAALPEVLLALGEPEAEPLEVGLALGELSLPGGGLVAQRHARSPGVLHLRL